jgi:D-ribose pyranase
MLKQGILHPQLAQLLALMRHKDMLIIADAGLPVPKDVERVDLGWRPHDPAFHDVLEEILKFLVVEKVFFAEEALHHDPEFHKKSLSILPKDIEIEYVPHVEFKRKSESVKAIILTGEFTGYTNVILVSGCAY